MPSMRLAVAEVRKVNNTLGKATYSLPNLLNSFPTIGCAEIVFTEKYGFGLPVVKPYERVFPIPNMVAKADIEHLVPEVIAVKVEPKGVYNTFTLVHHHQDRRCITASSSRSLDLATEVWC